MASFVGSIVINFWASGTQSGVTAVIDSVAGSLTNGSFAVALPGGSFSMDAYLIVDGSVYNGLGGTATTATAVPTTSEPSSIEKLPTGAIIVGSIVGVVLLVFITIFMVVVANKKAKGILVISLLLYTAAIVTNCWCDTLSSWLQ